MSNRKHRTARLSGYDGPYFPATLTAVHALLGATTHFNSGHDLIEVGKQVSGFQRDSEHLVTDDGYSWGWTLKFVRPEGTILICFPGHRDFANYEDGTQTDRHIAIYVKGFTIAANMVEPRLEILLQDFLRKMLVYAKTSEARHVLGRVLREIWMCDARNSVEGSTRRIKGAFKSRFFQDVEVKTDLDVNRSDPMVAATVVMNIDGKSTEIWNRYGQPHM